MRLSAPRGFLGAGVAAVVAVSSLLAAVPAGAADGGVPVLGQAVAVRTDQNDAAPVIVSVHGVRRVDGGTVVYWSFGFPADTPKDQATALSASGALGHTQLNYYPIDSGSGDNFGNVAVVDQAGATLYTGLVTPAKKCVCSSGLVLNHMKDGTPGVAYTMYAVVPALPAGVDTVNVSVGDQTFVGIPVQDGAMTPSADASAPIVLGTAWPAIDQAALSSVTDTGQSTLPLTQQISDLSGEVTTRKKARTTTVDLSSDVLFATDKATLSPAASKALAEGARQIKAAGATGQVTVVGHTDSTAGDAYNLALSKRRAEAVAAALRKLLPSSITYSVSGKGETEPIASNDTAQGRALNRRVSVTFTTGAGQ